MDTADGQVAVAPSNDIVYANFLKVFGMEHFPEDPRMDTNEVRMQNKPLLRRFLKNSPTTSRIGNSTREGSNSAGAALRIS